jgi:hypothetical protein
MRGRPQEAQGATKDPGQAGWFSRQSQGQDFLQKAEGMMRRWHGQAGRRAGSMNRPPSFGRRQMSVEDVLNGGDDAATRYFRVTQKFLPIVRQKAQLAEYFAGAGKKFKCQAGKLRGAQGSTACIS